MSEWCPEFLKSHVGSISQMSLSILNHLANIKEPAFRFLISLSPQPLYPQTTFADTFTFSSMHFGATFRLLFVAASSTLLGSTVAIDTLLGPVTANDIAEFKAAARKVAPSTSTANETVSEWAQGLSGESTKAFGLVYEVSQDVDILNKMITFCDTVLSIRNDLSGKGCKIWTDAVDPVWVNCSFTNPIHTGGEQGDPVGHLGNCARQILATKSIWTKTVPDQDPHDYGKTYLDRAKMYVKQADCSVDGHILKLQLTTDHKDRQYFSMKDPYKSGEAVPWNQQMMFNYGFYNLAISHEILGDAPDRVKRYDALVQASVDWFFSVVVSYKDKKGNTAYNWNYNLTLPLSEDSNHGSLDVAGFSRLYASDRYGITAAKMKPFANIVADLIILGGDRYSGLVDGTSTEPDRPHSAMTTFLQSGFLLTAEFKPSIAAAIIGASLKVGQTNDALDQLSRALWVKYRLNKG
ncbi:hypothetical protein BGZ83_008127 [Gryganskiella cystojenkinii]|nr:hypothetical protein BGZ83_008127 [Gryganskiella cystojenkinii]